MKTKKFESVQSSKCPTIDNKLLEIQEAIDSPQQLIREIECPSDLVVALSSGRGEMVCLAKPRAMTAEEVKVLYDIIGCLINTNNALQRHSECIAELSEQLTGHLKGFMRSNTRLLNFARFQTPSEDEVPDDKTTT